MTEVDTYHPILHGIGPRGTYHGLSIMGTFQRIWQILGCQPMLDFFPFDGISWKNGVKLWSMIGRWDDLWYKEEAERTLLVLFMSEFPVCKDASFTLPPQSGSDSFVENFDEHAT